MLGVCDKSGIWGCNKFKFLEGFGRGAVKQIYEYNHEALVAPQREILVHVLSCTFY